MSFASGSRKMALIGVQGSAREVDWV